MSANGNGMVPAGLEQPAAGETPAGIEALTSLLATLPIFAAKSRGTDSAAEAKDYMQAALFAAQAITTLDPTRIDGGNDPEAKKASTPTPPVRDTDRDGKVSE